MSTQNRKKNPTMAYMAILETKTNGLFRHDAKPIEGDNIQ